MRATFCASLPFLYTNDHHVTALTTEDRSFRGGGYRDPALACTITTAITDALSLFTSSIITSYS